MATEEHDVQYRYDIEEGNDMTIDAHEGCRTPTRILVGFLTRVFSIIGDENYEAEEVGEAAAAFYIQWAVHQVPEKGATFDIIVMSNDPDREHFHQGSTMVSIDLVIPNAPISSESLPEWDFVDASVRPPAARADQALKPEEVSPQMKDIARELLEEIWRSDSRIEELYEAVYGTTTANAA